MPWTIIDQSSDDAEGPALQNSYTLKLQDGSGREARVRIRAAEGTSMSVADARATIELHLDRPALPDYLVFGADWPNDSPDADHGNLSAESGPLAGDIP